MATKTARKQKTSTATTTITLPALAKGEKWAGVLLDAKGAPSHHVILLPRDKRDVTWEEAKAFVKECGGELPTRKEQSLLFANLPGEFEPRWYWSGEQPAGEPAYAWGQGFGYGTQGWGHVSFTYRARAVRRVPVQ